MSEFELDPRLAGDSVALADIGAIHVRAMELATSSLRASMFPWTEERNMPMTPAAPTANTLSEINTSMAV